MIDWGDFQIILAIHRSHTLSDAARLLKVNQSTISRALQRIEGQIKQAIFFNVSGMYQITPFGERFLRVAEKFDEATEELSRSDAPSTTSGVIRLTSVEWFISGYLTVNLSEFQKQYPGIAFEFNGSNETKNLLKRGYDLSLRLDREQKSGSLIQRKIADFGVGIYGRAASSNQTRLQTKVIGNWLGYETALSEIPEEKWLRRKFKNHVPSIRVSSYVSMEKAIAEGLGIGLLPFYTGDKNPLLQRVSGSRAILTRSIWLISHPEARRQASVDCFIKWLTADLESNKREFLGIS